jgi:hypothetical protein
VMIVNRRNVRSRRRMLAEAVGGKGGSPAHKNAYPRRGRIDRILVSVCYHRSKAQSTFRGNGRSLQGFWRCIARHDRN